MIQVNPALFGNGHRTVEEPDSLPPAALSCEHSELQWVLGDDLAFLLIYFSGGWVNLQMQNCMKQGDLFVCVIVVVIHISLIVKTG